MIEGLKPYPAMKDSRVSWLGEVPEHWEVRRIGDSTEGCINGIWGGEPNGRDDLTCVRVADFDRWQRRVKLRKPTMRAIEKTARTNRLLRRGDLLLEKSGGGDLQPVGAVVLYDYDIPAVCSNFIARVPVARGFDPAFVCYLHMHLYAIRLNTRSIKQTTGIQNLDSSAYLGEPVAFPPLPEQAAIVRFLDHAERRIRRYVRAKQKLIKLLEEQRQAIIYRAVTRGLDQNVRLMPSGQEWIGDVPAHWDLVPNRAYLRLKKEVVGTRSGDYVLLSLTKRGVIARDIENPEGKFPTSFDTYQVIEPGDFVFCLFDIDETPRAVGLSTLHGMITGAYARFTCDPSIAEWVHLFYLAMDNGKRLKPLYTGLRKVITRSRFLGAKIPMPPPEERIRLVAEVQHATRGATDAISRAQREIDLLTEFRTRLISDVVTGKLDVREAATRLPADDLESNDPLDDTEGDGDEEDDSSVESGVEGGDGG